MEKQYTVLLVNDDLEICKAMAQIINQLPEFRVVGLARDGIEGLRSFAELQPDIVITDDVMPKMDGLTMINMIRVVKPDIKVLLMSVRAGELAAEERKQAQITLSLLCPFATIELLDALSAVVRGEVLNLDE